MKPGHAVLDAYERWAPTYSPTPHNPVMVAEQNAMFEVWPTMQGARVLDLACGTGRYATLMAQDRASQVVAVDFSANMLQRVVTGERVRASMMRLPFRSGSFDIVVSGLALAHADDLQTWMSEVSRVLDDQGTLLYSDFHPEAVRAGMTRTFKDASQRKHTVPHRIFDVEHQVATALACGLTIDRIVQLRVGFEFQEDFDGAETFYRDWHGVPLVLVIRARKAAL